MATADEILDNFEVDPEKCVSRSFKCYKAEDND